MIDTTNPTVHTEYAGNYIYSDNESEASMQLQFMSHPEGYIEPTVVGGTRTSKSVKGVKSDGAITYSNYSYVFQYKDHLGNVRLSYSDTNLNGAIEPRTEIIEESNYYPFGLKQKGYNDVVNGGNSTAQKFKYNGVELNEDLGLNLYEMDLRSYDPAIARFNGIDPVTHYSQGTSVAFDNNPVFWADPSGGNSENFASTVVDRNGIVIDHRSDGDPNIYLDNFFGMIVGQEETGKKYEKGDKVFEVTGEIDTLFELILEQTNVTSEITNLLDSVREDVDLLNQLLEKAKKGHPLSQEDYSTISLLLSSIESSKLKASFANHKLSKIKELFNAYLKEIQWNEVGYSMANTAINAIFSLGSVLGAAEFPDGEGRTVTGTVRQETKESLNLRPSNVTRRHQKLPYSLNYYD